MPHASARVGGARAVLPARAFGRVPTSVPEASSRGLDCENETGPGGNPAPSRSFEGAKERSKRRAANGR
jgi:hypothetical protein